MKNKDFSHWRRVLLLGFCAFAAATLLQIPIAGAQERLSLSSLQTQIDELEETVAAQESWDEMITIRFEGALTYVAPHLNEIFSVGETLSAIVTYDFSTPDVAPELPWRGIFEYAIKDLDIQVGSYSASATSGHVSLESHAERDHVAFTSNRFHGLTGPSIDEYTPWSFLAELTDSSSEAFSSVDMPWAIDPGAFPDDSTQLTFCLKTDSDLYRRCISAESFTATAPGVSVFTLHTEIGDLTAEIDDLWAEIDNLTDAVEALENQSAPGPVSGYEVVTSETVSIETGGNHIFTVTCPIGKRPISHDLFGFNQWVIIMDVKDFGTNEARVNVSDFSIFFGFHHVGPYSWDTTVRTVCLDAD